MRGAGRGAQRGVLAVEAAFVLPVVIAGAMMFMELASIGLTIDIGNTALERALQEFRPAGAAGVDMDDMEDRIRQQMAAASHGYLTAGNIVEVSVERFSSLDAMGKGGDSAADTSSSTQQQVPVWRVTVDIRKDFITPIPRLMALENTNFRYRYQQLLGYLPKETS
ncbi:hypothetical protein [Uliginosibacterium sediminicola]|uniref:TadE-like protein n=1 Tax=Uliginosibacterium sediminicola TaxID=2024550 RepID=A0ABU9YZF8_9RHOO